MFAFFFLHLFRAGFCLPQKCPSTKNSKFAIGPPTSSASLLAFAPPANSYLKPIPTSDKNPNEFSNSRSSACDPLIPANSLTASPYATADIVSVNMSGLTGSRPAAATTTAAATAANTTGTLPWLTADLPAVEFPRKNLKFVEMLGEGQFGEVRHFCFSVLQQLERTVRNKCRYKYKYNERWRRNRCIFTAFVHH
jgi:hypothetical protein